MAEGKSRADALRHVSEQCTWTKKHCYDTLRLIEQIPHDEQRTEARRLWQEAYDAWDKLQTFVESK